MGNAVYPCALAIAHSSPENLFIVFSVDIQILFFQWILKEGVVLHDIGPTDIGRIVELTKKYRDMPMDFADATLVIVAERTEIRKMMIGGGKKTVPGNN